MSNSKNIKCLSSVVEQLYKAAICHWEGLHGEKHFAKDRSFQIEWQCFKADYQIVQLKMAENRRESPSSRK